MINRAGNSLVLIQIIVMYSRIIEQIYKMDYNTMRKFTWLLRVIGQTNEFVRASDHLNVDSRSLIKNFGFPNVFK